MEYSESSEEEEEGPGAAASSPSMKGGRSHPLPSEESKAKVRFRYSRGTAEPFNINTPNGLTRLF